MATKTEMSVRSLSPAAWYMYSPKKAERDGGRGQVGQMYATKTEAEAALKRLNTPIGGEAVGMRF